MRKIKVYYILLAGIMSVMLLIAACSPASEEESLVVSGKMTDQLGRSIVIPDGPERIISLAPSNTEILFSLGLDEKVAAVTDYCDFPVEAQQKPSIGGFSNPNLEEIIALQPELVLATSMHEQSLIPQLEQRGLTVFALNPKTMEEVCDAITMVGEITGRKEESREVVRDIEQRVENVQAMIKALQPGESPTVFYAVWHDPLMAAGSNTLQDVLITMAGGINIASKLDEYADISLEYLIEADPEVIIVNTSHGSNVNETLGFLQTEPRLENTSARLNGHIYEIDGNLSSRPGPRLVDGLEIFTKYIHPELFE